MSDHSDIRTTTTLVCASFAWIIALPPRALKRPRSLHRAFFFLAADIGGWYFSQAIYVLTGTVEGTWPWWLLIRSAAVCGALLPLQALRLFDAMARREPVRWLERVLPLATVVAVAFAVVVGPQDLWVRVTLFVYVLGALAAVLFSLYPRGVRGPLAAVRRGASFPFVLGTLACVMTVTDFVSLVWDPRQQVASAPVGAMLSVVFLFALREALHSERLPEFRELFARVSAAIALGALMAVILFGLSQFLGEQFDTTYLNAVLGITVCLSFDVLRNGVEAQTRRFLLPESDLEPSLELLQRRLLHVLTLDEMSAMVMNALHASRRLTGAGLFQRDLDNTGFDPIASTGSYVPSRVEVATARPLLDRLATGPLSLDALERAVRSRDDEGVPSGPRDQAALSAAAVLGGRRNMVVAGIRDEAGDLVGLLVAFNERSGGAFSPDEILALGKLAAQIGVVIENSRAYAEMKERDRLAVIGQMTAGLAHEIRNPLGSIKGAAQLLVRLAEDPSSELDPRKYLATIVAEVDRLDRVLARVLDLAPQKPTVAPIDVNAVVRRTLQVFSAEPGHEDLEVRDTLDPGLPRVEIDPDQLQQVLLNLFRNSAQATEGRGKVGVTTTARVGRTSWRGDPRVHDTLVEILVTDDGPGISRKVREKLFVPFVTTKREGTGLGLAVSQKIVQEAKGRIEVRSRAGAGTTFAVVLPAAMDALGTPTPGLAEGVAAPGSPRSC